MNINRLWPSLDDVFDGTNWSVIHSTKQIRTVAVAPPAPASVPPPGGTTQTEQKLADVFSGDAADAADEFSNIYSRGERLVVKNIMNVSSGCG